MIQFDWHPFSELTLKQLYAILKLRADVFVVEQCCVYPDLDEKDFSALHLLGIEENILVAYLRLFPPTEKNNHFIFGRVVTHPIARKKGYGKQLMQNMLQYCDPNVDIRCSAQLYLKSFYESFGFKAEGEPYDEDGILHIAMYKTSYHQ